MAAACFAITTQYMPFSLFLFILKDSLICLLIRFLTTAFFDTLRDTAIPSLAEPGRCKQKTIRKYFPWLRTPLENTLLKSAFSSSLLDLSKASDTKAYRHQALSEARPLARRALIIARPLRVFILARKPWRRLRFKTLGWNVLFMISVFDFNLADCLIQAIARKEFRVRCKRVENVLFVGLHVNS